MYTIFGCESYWRRHRTERDCTLTGQVVGGSIEVTNNEVEH